MASVEVRPPVYETRCDRCGKEARSDGWRLGFDRDGSRVKFSPSAFESDARLELARKLLERLPAPSVRAMLEERGNLPPKAEYVANQGIDLDLCPACTSQLVAWLLDGAR